MIGIYEKTVAFAGGKPIDPDPDLTLKEHYLYGSSRLGLIAQSIVVNGSTTPPSGTLSLESVERLRGKRRFELSNHLGNTLNVISDLRLGVDTEGATIGDRENACMQFIIL